LKVTIEMSKVFVHVWYDRIAKRPLRLHLQQQHAIKACFKTLPSMVRSCLIWLVPFQWSWSSPVYLLWTCFIFDMYFSRFHYFLNFIQLIMMLLIGVVFSISTF